MELLEPGGKDKSLPSQPLPVALLNLPTQLFFFPMAGTPFSSLVLCPCLFDSVL